MVNVAAILPCRGRPEQTVANVRRLLSTAGAPFQLICVGGKDEHALLDQLSALGALGAAVLKSDATRATYWQALAGATQQTDAQLLVNLANDLIPGQHWLKRAVEAYRWQFGQTNPVDGLLGFNGDSHEVGHSCHFLIARSLLDRYGGWPVWYDHNFGDTELCQRAIQDGVYAKAAWALLFHDHPYFGGDDDSTYAEGRALAHKDEQLYLERKRMGWPSATGVISARPMVPISAVPPVG